MAEAPLPSDPGLVVPVSYKIVHELREREDEAKLTDLVARLKNAVRFEGRKVLYSWIGGTRRDWRGRGTSARSPRSPRRGRTRRATTKWS
jgi:hypothetical protein